MAPAQSMGRRRGVTLGIMPDFAGNVKNGLRADFVTPGKPAALGGMVKGDIIVAIDNKPVNDIEDYMFRLSQLKPGQTITVEVIRDGKQGTAAYSIVKLIYLNQYEKVPFLDHSRSDNSCGSNVSENDRPHISRKSYR